MHVKYAFLHCSYAAPVRVSVKSTAAAVVVARGDTVVALRVVVVVARGDTVCVVDAARVVVALRAVLVVVARCDVALRAGAVNRDVVRDAVCSVVEMRCCVVVAVAEFVRFFALPSRTAASDATMHIMQQNTKARIFFISG